VEENDDESIVHDEVEEQVLGGEDASDDDSESDNNEDTVWEECIIEPLQEGYVLRHTGAGNGHVISTLPPLPPLAEGQIREQTGPRNIDADHKKPIHFFTRLFPISMWERFTEQTNSFAHSKEVNDWVDMSGLEPPEEDEPQVYGNYYDFRKFLACLLHMGMFKFPTMKDHWNTTDGSSFVKKLFSRDRFLSIFSNLHWLNTADISEEEKMFMKQSDGFWPYSEWLELLRHNF
jgi:hypothetical protein